MKFMLRDILWLTVVVAMALAWWVQSRRPPEIEVGQPVLLVRFEAGYGTRITRGVVSGVDDARFRIDNALAYPIREGIVLNTDGECLGMFSGEKGKQIDATRLDAIRPLLPKRR